MQGFLCFVQLNHRKLKATLHRFRSPRLHCTLEQRSPVRVGFNGNETHRLHPYHAGTSELPNPTSGVLCPPRRPCAIKSVQRTPPAQLTTDILKPLLKWRRENCILPPAHYVATKGQNILHPLSKDHQARAARASTQHFIILFLDGGGRRQSMPLSVSGNIFLTRATMEIHSSQKVLLHLRLNAKQPRTSISTLLSQKLDYFFF